MKRGQHEEAQGNRAATGLKSYIIDVDGVIVAGNMLIPAAEGFLQRLTARGCKFLILTKNPI